MWIVVAIFAANFFDQFVVAIWLRARPGGVPLFGQESLLGVHLIFSSVLQTVILAMIVRTSGVPFREYFGLVLPRILHVLMGTACMIGLLIIVHGWMFLLKGSILPFLTDAYRASQNAGTLALLWLGVVIAAPVVEELTFRGFSFAGWSRSRIGVKGAIVASSLVWMLTHGFLGWLFTFGIFCLGLIFGWVRWRSGSTILTIFLHAIVNLVVMFDVAVVVGRGS
jgi:membrane protease YdiL (CAAX protease family)